MEVKMELTTVQLEKDTLKKLKNFKEYNRESYNEVINKLMKFKEVSEIKLTEQTKKDVDGARKEKSVSLSDAIRELGVKIEL
jgi:hypothetical protein